ncbi:autorepressor SdpR family transcription factor [Faecalibaculum rodentium]|uniref:autorepressor SdpR family transcription factor n=2 Tax=Faecalibaculum rodentium TaxID=1702221 RepID=UPI0023EFEA9B|nr:autorepressor SdpR family transcription factor [Faecalibaculum rodentium]
MPIDTTLKALNDPVRRQILHLLQEKSMTVGELVSHFDISQPAISRHLAVLKKADLIRDSRQGKYVTYSLSTSVLEEMILWIRELKGETDETAVTEIPERTGR